MQKESIIETQRLLLRPLAIDDDEGMFELDSNLEVIKYITPLPSILTSIEQSRKVISSIQEQHKDNSVSRLAIIIKETDEFIGWISLKLIKKEINGHVNYYEVAYRFIPRYWGKGYATEATSAIVKYGFEVLKVEKIYAIVMRENLGSRKVLKKSGFQQTGDFEYIGVLMDWFEIAIVP